MIPSSPVRLCQRPCPSSHSRYHELHDERKYAGRSKELTTPRVVAGAVSRTVAVALADSTNTVDFHVRFHRCAPVLGFSVANPKGWTDVELQAGTLLAMQRFMDGKEMKGYQFVLWQRGAVGSTIFRGLWDGGDLDGDVGSAGPPSDCRYSGVCGGGDGVGVSAVAGSGDAGAAGDVEACAGAGGGLGDTGYTSESSPAEPALGM